MLFRSARVSVLRIWVFKRSVTCRSLGFPESEMLILLDDGRAHAPTRRNIEDAFARICQYSQDGDVVWVHYSGHGGRVRDTSGDEEDGYDSTLIPVDFRSSGQILDDDGT